MPDPNLHHSSGKWIRLRIRPFTLGYLVSLLNVFKLLTNTLLGRNEKPAIARMPAVHRSVKTEFMNFARLNQDLFQLGSGSARNNWVTQQGYVLYVYCTYVHVCTALQAHLVALHKEEGQVGKGVDG